MRRKPSKGNPLIPAGPPQGPGSSQPPRASQPPPPRPQPRPRNIAAIQEEFLQALADLSQCKDVLAAADPKSDPGAPKRMMDSLVNRDRCGLLLR